MSGAGTAARTGLAERFGEFAAELTLERLPAAVVSRAKDCLVHGFAIAAAGVGVGFAEQAEAATGVEAGAGRSHVLSSGATAPAPLAAYANGALFHARAQEDTHGTFHPGVATTPAALAVAEARGADGPTLLAAVVAGYEVGIALSAPLTDLTTPPFRATGVFGPIAAAGGAGRALGLDRGQMGSAFALAAAFAGGSTEAFGAGSDEWHFQSGLAATSGVLAAQTAAAGARGSRLAFEGEAGYLDCYAPERDPGLELGAGLGREWGILDVTFKPYPVCAFNQPVAMTAVRLARAAELRPQEIERVIVRMNHREGTYPGVPFEGPYENLTQTLMSVRFCTAAALRDRHVDLPTLRSVEDPELLDLVSRIELIAEPERAAKSAAIEVRTADGRLLKDEIADSQDLLSWDGDAVRENAHRLLPEMQMGEPELERVIAAVDGLDRAAALDELTAALGAAAAPTG